MENENNSLPNASNSETLIPFLLGVVGFFITLFIPFIGIIVNGFGTYYGYKMKTYLYLIMNILSFLLGVASIVFALVQA